MYLRNSVKAIIIKDEKVLTIKCKDKQGVFYLLPGGGQEPEETFINTLKRECVEEIGCDVKPEDLVLVREYIGKNHEFAEFDSDVHQIEYMFRCNLLSETKLGSGTLLDRAQQGIEWLELEHLKQYRIYPSVLKEALPKLGKEDSLVYLGDVN